MRIIYLTVSAGLCVVPLCAWAGVSFYDHGVTPVASSTVERATKGDRTQRAFNVGTPAFSVEFAGQPYSTVTVRDRDGSLLYQVDPDNRMTIVAKRTDRTRAIPATSQHATDQENPVIVLPLPEGCESAFSPYAAPSSAHVIGRCIS
jgi:hypothetical protein